MARKYVPAGEVVLFVLQRPREVDTVWSIPYRELSSPEACEQLSYDFNLELNRVGVGLTWSQDYALKFCERLAAKLENLACGRFRREELVDQLFHPDTRITLTVCSTFKEVD